MSRLAFRFPWTLLVTTVLFAQRVPAQRPEDAMETLERARVVEGQFYVSWTPDGQLLEREPDRGGTRFIAVDPRTGTRTPFLPDVEVRAVLEQYHRLSGKTVAALPFQKILWACGGHAFVFTDNDGVTYFFNRDAKTLRSLKRPDRGVASAAGPRVLVDDSVGHQAAGGTFSPDYSRIAYVRGYDLYVMNTATGAETRLTFGGSDAVAHGRLDWSYWEELGQTTAVVWSPDGRKIAYFQFDERAVTRYPIVHDLHRPATVEWKYYPLAGEHIPVATLFVRNLATHRTVRIQDRRVADHYLLHPLWTPDSKTLLVQRLNRHQDSLELLAANPTTGAVRTVLVEHDTAFVNLAGTYTIRFLHDGARFLWSSERTGWRQWYVYDLTGRLRAQLTSGSRVFTQVLAVDEAQGTVYLTAQTEDGQECHLFRASLMGDRTITQLTAPGGVHTIDMDPTGHYYVDVFTSPTIPLVATLHTVDGDTLRHLGSIRYHLEHVSDFTPEEVAVTAADERTTLHGRLYKPIGYDVTKKYPLLVQVYGGPSAQLVERRNAVGGYTQQLAQEGYVVWSVDNRGTPNRGRDFERATYGRLGQVDLDDQAVAVRQLLAARPYIDATRVGIVGGSYGGYLSVLALLRYPELFTVGVALSPVTDWRNYDAPYTERYMRTPQENALGYDAGSAVKLAPALRGHLLIVHGTADDNVHVGNVMQLLHALTIAGKPVPVVLYPEERHMVPASQMVKEFLKEYLPPTAP